MGRILIASPLEVESYLRFLFRWCQIILTDTEKKKPIQCIKWATERLLKQQIRSIIVYNTNVIPVWFFLLLVQYIDDEDVLDRCSKILLSSEEHFG